MTRRIFLLLAAFAILSFPSATAFALDNTWVDRIHTYLEDDLYGSVAWFDDFFEDDLSGELDNVPSSVRVTNDFRWDEEEQFEYRLRVRARIRLPHLKGKWRLTISAENQGDPNATEPEDPGNPGLAVVATDGRASTELAYDFLRTRSTILFAGVGVKISTHPSAFARVRLVHARELGYAVVGRFAVTPYYDTKDGFGNTDQADFERAIDPTTMVRWNNTINIDERTTGWYWGTTLSVLRKLSPFSGITVGGGATGPTRPSAVVDNYRAFVLYRAMFLRNWLYWELEPDVNWPLRDDGGRKAVLGGTIRLEMNFTGTAPVTEPPRRTSPAAR